MHANNTLLPQIAFNLINNFTEDTYFLGGHDHDFTENNNFVECNDTKILYYKYDSI